MLSFDKSPDSWRNSDMETAMLPLCTPFFGWTAVLGEALGSWTTKFPLLLLVLVWWQPTFVDLHTQHCVKYPSHVSSRHLPTESVRWVLQVRKVSNLSQQGRCIARAPRSPTYLDCFLISTSYFPLGEGKGKTQSRLACKFIQGFFRRAPNQWGVVEKADEPDWGCSILEPKLREKKSPIWFFLFLNLITSTKKTKWAQELLRLPKAFIIPCAVLCSAQSLQSCTTLHNPMDCSPQGSSVHGILQGEY